MDIGWPHLIGTSAGGSLLTWATLQLVPALKARLENARRNGNSANGKWKTCAFNIDELDRRITQPLVDSQERLSNTVERLVGKMDHLIEEMAEQRGFQKAISK